MLNKNFCNVKENITDIEIQNLLAPSVYRPTPERLAERARAYQANPKTEVYAYREKGEYLGILVFEMETWGKGRAVSILDLAVVPAFQGRGIGGRMIGFLFRQFPVIQITAETDGDALGFYKKYGFSVTDTTKKFDTTRYICRCRAEDFVEKQRM